MEVQTDVDTDHDVALVSLIPCPLSISAGLVGASLIQGLSYCLKLGTIEGQGSYR